MAGGSCNYVDDRLYGCTGSIKLNQPNVVMTEH